MRNDGSLKFKSDDPIRFGCTACGKCCISQPTMPAAEAIRYFRSFPLVFTPLIVPFDPSRHNAFSVFAKRTDAAISSKVHGYRYASTLLLIDHRPKSGKCGALEESGKCTLYPNHPTICRLMPFPAGVTDSYIASTPALFGKTVSAKYAIGDAECDDGENAPVVYANGELVDPIRIAARDEEIAYHRTTNFAIRDCHDLYDTFRNGETAGQIFTARGMSGYTLAVVSTHLIHRLVRGFNEIAVSKGEQPLDFATVMVEQEQLCVRIGERRIAELMNKSAETNTTFALEASNVFTSWHTAGSA